MTLLLGPEIMRVRTFNQEQEVVKLIGALVYKIVIYKSRLYVPDEIALRIMKRLMEHAVSREEVMQYLKTDCLLFDGLKKWNRGKQTRVRPGSPGFSPR